MYVCKRSTIRWPIYVKKAHCQFCEMTESPPNLRKEPPASRIGKEFQTNLEGNYKWTGADPSPTPRT